MRLLQNITFGQKRFELNPNILIFIVDIYGYYVTGHIKHLS